MVVNHNDSFWVHNIFFYFVKPKSVKYYRMEVCGQWLNLYHAKIAFFEVPLNGIFLTVILTDVQGAVSFFDKHLTPTTTPQDMVTVVCICTKIAFPVAN